MTEPMLEKIRRFMLEGWTSKPAWIRAFGWALTGYIIGAIT